MKRLIVTIIHILMIINQSTAQFSSSDFIITTKGLSAENAKRFTDKKHELVEAFNVLGISAKIKPLKIQIIYENNKGLIRIDIPYEDSSLYSSNSENMQQSKTWGSYGDGVSIFMQNKIFLALSVYKRQVALSNNSIDQEILGFESLISLRKINGDWMNFYAYEGTNSDGSITYTNVFFKFAGKEYENQSSKPESVNKIHYFYVGKAVGLDGKKTASYYFLKFFNLGNK